MLNCRKCKHDHNKVTCEKRRRETSHCFEAKPETYFDRMKDISLDEMAEFLTDVRLEIAMPIFEQMGYTKAQINDLKIKVTAVMKNFLESEVQKDD